MNSACEARDVTLISVESIEAVIVLYVKANAFLAPVIDYLLEQLDLVDSNVRPFSYFTTVLYRVHIEARHHVVAIDFEVFDFFLFISFLDAVFELLLDLRNQVALHKYHMPISVSEHILAGNFKQVLLCRLIPVG